MKRCCCPPKFRKYYCRFYYTVLNFVSVVLKKRKLKTYSLHTNILSVRTFFRRCRSCCHSWCSSFGGFFLLGCSDISLLRHYFRAANVSLLSPFRFISAILVCLSLRGLPCFVLLGLLCRRWAYQYSFLALVDTQMKNADFLFFFFVFFSYTLSSTTCSLHVYALPLFSSAFRSLVLALPRPQTADCCHWHSFFTPSPVETDHGSQQSFSSLVTAVPFPFTHQFKY